MSSIHKTIQKRTTAVRDAIQNEWHNRWWQCILDNLDKEWDWKWISKHYNLQLKGFPFHKRLLLFDQSQLDVFLNLLIDIMFLIYF